MKIIHKKIESIVNYYLTCFSDVLLINNFIIFYVVLLCEHRLRFYTCEHKLYNYFNIEKFQIYLNFYIVYSCKNVEEQDKNTFLLLGSCTYHDIEISIHVKKKE